MLGEVGLDSSARLRWPVSARCLHPESACASVSEAIAEKSKAGAGAGAASRVNSNTDVEEGTDGDELERDGFKEPIAGASENRIEAKAAVTGGGHQEEEWKRLTPFKVSMSHQRAILDAQLEVAVEMGVNVSFHSVAAAGECGVIVRITTMPLCLPFFPYFPCPFTPGSSPTWPCCCDAARAAQSMLHRSCWAADGDSNSSSGLHS